MKNLRQALVIIIFFVALVGAVIGLGMYWQHQKAAPVQPIAFSHEKHAGELKLACTHCHQNVDKGPQATVPAMSICMECHKKVAVDKPEIKKLTKYWKDKTPIPWVKVNHLPWHALFNHKRHIKAGVDCAVCHGDIKEMQQVRRVRSLKMGFCVSCHRQNNAPTDCYTCHK